MQPRLIVEQKITVLVNKYQIFNVDTQGNKANLVALAQQKRMAFKEKVTFYTDEAKTTEIFGFRAEKVLDVHGRFIVEDPSGTRIGAFKKQFKKSLIKSTWDIIDENDQVIFTVRENNTALAILRRFGGMIPIIGNLIEIITAFLRFHFEFIDASTGQVVGEYRKTTVFRDHYTLLLTDDAYAKDDWRTFAAMSVALDALQAR